MFRGRGKRLAVAVVSCGLIGAISMVAVPLSASAQGTETTSVTVTTHPAATTTGHALTIIAKVASVTGNADTVRAVKRAAGDANVPTGTVIFTITGTAVTSNAQTVNCRTSNTVTLKHGKAICRVPVEVLTHVSSPYTISAAYSGDDNFAPNTGFGSETVGIKATHTKVKVDSRPTSGTGNTFTAVVHGGPGGSLLTGTVLFSVSDTPSQPKTLRTCEGGDSQPLVVVGKVGTATCTLAPGWFIVPSATHMTPHPHGAWNVTASYSGDGNFSTSLGSKSGHSRV